MFVLDVNILIYAFRRDLPRHEIYYRWLTAALAGGRRVGVATWVELTVLRINTLPSLSDRCAEPQDVFAFLSALRMQVGYEVIEPGPEHLSILQKLCQALNLRGNDVNDAFLAALALERGATLVSADRGFKRFTDLQWLDPGDEPG